jgi:serralysin
MRQVVPIAAAVFGLAGLFATPAAAQEIAREGLEAPCSAHTDPRLYPSVARLVPAELPEATRSRLRAVVVRTLTWKPGELVKVCFRSGTQGARARVAKYASEWMRYANIRLEFGEPGNYRNCAGDNSEAIKIDFVDGGPKSGFWSALGTLSRKEEHSLNLAYLGRDQLPVDKQGRAMPEAEARRLILHEFGHALGLVHEHQSPAAQCGKEYYEEAVMAYGALRGWPKDQTVRNFQQYNEMPELNASAVDRKSIMHYSLPPWLFKAGDKSPCFVSTNFELSDGDKEFVARHYPTSRPNGNVAGAPAPTLTRSGTAATPAQEYADLLKASGLAADRIEALVAEFRKETR